MHILTDVLLYWCTVTQLYWCTVILLYWCTVVLLNAVALFSVSLVVILLHYTIVLLNAVALFSVSFVVILLHYAIVLLNEMALFSVSLVVILLHYAIVLLNAVALFSVSLVILLHYAQHTSNHSFCHQGLSWVSNEVMYGICFCNCDKWVPVTMTWHVLKLWVEERPPIWRVTANILNKQSCIADKRWSSSLGVGRGANNSSP